MEIIKIIIVVFTIAIFLFFKFHNQKKGEITISEFKERCGECYDEKQGYRFYTNGHPYVWVEINYQEFLELMDDGIYLKGQHGNKIFPRFSYDINKDSKQVYVVPLVKDFNFSSLKHYQEWLDSQKQVAENIAKYKNS